LLGAGFRFAQSHTNDPLGCAVALEVITVMEEERMVDKCQAIGTYFLQQLKKLQDNFSCIRSVRGRGLMLAIELESEVPFNAESIFNALLVEKFLVGFQPVYNVVRFYPALTISSDDIDRLVVALNHIFNKRS
jgi:acetylornithine aminotransferase